MGNNIFGNSVRKELIFWVGTKIDKRQYRDGGGSWLCGGVHLVGSKCTKGKLQIVC
jgi:hypothetical protein